MKIIKNKKEIGIVVGCTRDEIADAIAILEALEKNIPVDNRPRFPKAKPVEMFLAHIRRRGLPEELCVEF